MITFTGGHSALIFLPPRVVVDRLPNLVECEGVVRYSIGVNCW